ncbi:hypothetical protein BDV40DRAFT_252281 [Aspergillus tamarii]|uniref:Uncharacterized protein n=1 Tax=Aspergillus tamarii TaxID=41984 RepID=A0A5N6VBJ4_ASPTM|nr:hypothetical protein BDV40DRAFT_252281 [Aspergillus tamarii]
MLSFHLHYTTALRCDLAYRFQVKLTVVAAITFSVHAFLLCNSPPEEQNLSSLILCMIGGSMTLYISSLLLW